MAARDNEHAALWARAREAGIAAGRAERPPTYTWGRSDMNFGAEGIVPGSEFTTEGLSGTTYVVIRPGNSSFANWARRQNLGFRHYYGGYAIPVHDHGQSYERGRAHANAAIEVLREAGVNAGYHEWLS